MAFSYEKKKKRKWLQYGRTKTVKEEGGREPKENTRPKSIHNIYASNNVMVKVKSKILDCLLTFINNMIKYRKEGQKKLIKLDYKYIENVNRDFNLKMLNMKLKDFLSMDITRKKKSEKNNYNKVIIERIINKEELVEDYDTVIFVLNLKLKDWLDLFVGKKNINDLKNANSSEQVNIDFRRVDFGKIKNNIGEVIDLLRIILKKSNEQYLSCFTFILYNVEIWFLVKKSGKKKES